MSSLLYLLHLLEDDSAKYKALPTDKKFMLIIEMIKRKTIKDYQGLVKALTLVGWTDRQFMKAFVDLWDSKKIGFDELDVLDTNAEVFNGPGFISDRWLLTNIGQKGICDRIPPKHWGQLSYCKSYKELTGR